MEKIEETPKRMVNLSARRIELFKKASELSITTGAEIAIIVIYQSGRLRSFGHPSADAVIDRFVSGGESNCTPSTSMDCDSWRACMEAEEKLREAVAGGGGEKWWEQAVEGMGVEELEQYAAALKELIRNVDFRSLTVFQGSQS